ncbi:MAG: DUF6029 family protein [Myxococcales bacterium]|nr:DUF6029 family protein [Myxococcales bacterium]
MRPAAAVDFQIRGVPVRLTVTDSLFLGYHAFFEPISPSLGPPYGDPLNPFAGIERLAQGDNRLPLSRASKTAQAYGDLFHRFNLILSVWRIQAGLRLDTALFLNPPVRLDPNNLAAGGCGAPCLNRFENRWVSPTGLEKIFVTYTDRHLEITLGDFYAVFGRGLVLSVRKVDELAIDTTLLGAKLVYNPGRYKIVALGGVSNIQNIDESTGRFQADPFDIILGARIETRLFDKLLVGLHGAGGVLSAPRQGPILPASCAPDAPEQCPYSTGRLGYGLTLEAPRLLPWLDVYLEAAGLENMRHPLIYPDRQPRGYALYGSLTAYAGPLTILFEGKQYSRFEPWAGSTQEGEFANIAYTLHPTVERVLTEVEDPQSEIGGGRIHLTYRHSAALSFIVSNGAFRQGRYGELVLHALTLHDPYGGIMVRWDHGVSHLFVNGGHRYEYDNERDQVFKHTGWFDWDFIQSLPKNLSIESQGRALFRTRAGEPDWSEGNAYLALKWTPYLIFAGGLEWTTREINTKEAGVQYLQYALFPGGFVQYNITTRSSVRLFAGGQRGGLKCISGVCRVFPEFRGVRLEVVLRF